MASLKGFFLLSDVLFPLTPCDLCQAPQRHFVNGVDVWLLLDTYAQSDLTAGGRCRQVRCGTFVMEREMWRWSIHATCFHGLTIGDTYVIDEVQGTEFFSRRHLVALEFPNYQSSL